MLISTDANKLQHLRPEANRLRQERCFVRVNNGSFPNQVSLMWLHHLSLLEELPESESAGRKQQHGVVGEEGTDIPRLEGGVAINTDDGYHPCSSEVA